MKKIKTFITFLALIIFLTACNKNKSAAESTASASTAASTEVNVVERKLETISVLTLYDGTPFYLENAEGKMVYKDEAQIGEAIKLYVENGVPDQKEAIRLLSSGKEESFNFVHINYYGTDYWTRDIFITNNASLLPGIITTDTLTYTDADATTATTNKLEEGAILAVDENSRTTDSDLDIEFIAVTYYNGTSFGKNCFVKAENLSSNQADVLAAQTLKNLSANENLKAEIRLQIFEELQKLPVSSYMNEKIISAAVSE